MRRCQYRGPNDYKYDPTLRKWTESAELVEASKWVEVEPQRVGRFKIRDDRRSWKDTKPHHTWGSKGELHVPKVHNFGRSTIVENSMSTK